MSGIVKHVSYFRLSVGPCLMLSTSILWANARCLQHVSMIWAKCARRSWIVSNKRHFASVAFSHLGQKMGKVVLDSAPCHPFSVEYRPLNTGLLSSTLWLTSGRQMPTGRVVAMASANNVSFWTFLHYHCMAQTCRRLYQVDSPNLSFSEPRTLVSEPEMQHSCIPNVCSCSRMEVGSCANSTSVPMQGHWTKANLKSWCKEGPNLVKYDDAWVLMFRGIFAQPTVKGFKISHWFLTISWTMSWRAWSSKPSCQLSRQTKAACPIISDLSRPEQLEPFNKDFSTGPLEAKACCNSGWIPFATRPSGSDGGSSSEVVANTLCAKLVPHHATLYALCLCACCAWDACSTQRLKMKPVRFWETHPDMLAFAECILNNVAQRCFALEVTQHLQETKAKRGTDAEIWHVHEQPRPNKSRLSFFAHFKDRGILRSQSPTCFNVFLCSVVGQALKGLDGRMNCYVTAHMHVPAWAWNSVRTGFEVWTFMVANHQNHISSILFLSM